MANKDQVIRSQQLEIDRLKKHIEELESELYQFQLAGVGLSEGMQAIIEKADRDRADLTAQLRAQARIHEESFNAIKQIFPVQLLPPPEKANSVDEVLSPPNNEWKLYAVEGEVEQGLIEKGHPVFRNDENCWLGFSLVIRHDSSNTVKFRRWIYPFPGTLKDIEGEMIPRLMALLARAPMREDFASVGLYAKPDTLDKAMFELANHLYHHSNRTDLRWPRKIGNVFDHLIWPEVKKEQQLTEADRSDYADRFRKLVNRTFDNMEKTGRGKDTKDIRKKRRNALEALNMEE